MNKTNLCLLLFFFIAACHESKPTTDFAVGHYNDSVKVANDSIAHMTLRIVFIDDVTRPFLGSASDFNSYEPLTVPSSVICGNYRVTIRKKDDIDYRRPQTEYIMPLSKSRIVKN